MVIGLGFCAYLAVGSNKLWVRRGLLFTAALCVGGVVASFARAAFLAMILVFGVFWLRSNRKLKTLGAGVTAAVLIAATAAVLYGDAFWSEINSAFSEGASEGTGNDRWVLWGAAWQVFLENPIFGTGPNNWGIFASSHFAPGELARRYGDNPGTLYNRSLHNLYMQTLAELGITGAAALVWILVDFWKRNIRLRTEAAGIRWRMLGGTMDLRSMALALELAMVAFLAVAAVYSTAGKHWFFTIQGLNLLLYHWAVKERPPARPVVTSSNRRPVGRSSSDGSLEGSPQTAIVQG
jgi:O-antigen ligase